MKTSVCLAAVIAVVVIQLVNAQDPCTGTPNTRRCHGLTYRWSYKKSTQSCQKFSYYGCTPSPNTFTSLKTCENKCKPSNVCGSCDDDCYTYIRKGQAPKCICPNPCRDYDCLPGKVCRLSEPVCVREPCRPPPVASCVDDPCPETKPCGIRCAYGLMTDDNGCPLCKCCPKPT